MRLGIAGVNGRMGRLLVEEIRAAGATLIGGTARSETPVDVRRFASIDALAAACDAVIDFTRADTVVEHARALAASRTAWVLGTTGLDAQGEQAVKQASAGIAIVQAPNFSPGVTLLLVLAERMARALPALEYDAEILEMHHRQKIDAPSGTAMGLGQAVATGRGVHLHDLARSGRVGETGPRAQGEIGFASLRGGQIVGEHTLSFTSAAEQISLTHRTFDRRIFATGATRAALWANAKPAGLYGMLDVLGL